MPVVHSSASVLRTEGVFSGQGPSSKVSTTSWSRRKSSSLKCSNPKPGPPAVSISTVRTTPSALGLVHWARAGCGAWAVAGAAAACDAAAAADQILWKVPARHVLGPRFRSPFVERMRLRPCHHGLCRNRKGNAIVVLRGLRDLGRAAWFLAAEIVGGNSDDGKAAVVKLGP